MSVWCEVKRKGFGLFPLETDEHSFPVNLIRYMLKKGLCYTLCWIQFLVFSLPKWPVSSSEPLFEQIPNIVCQMNVPLQRLCLQGTECAAHTTYCRFRMGVETQRHGWFVTYAWDDPRLQWDRPVKLHWFGWNSNDCNDPRGLSAGLDQLAVEQLNSSTERGSYSKISASDPKLTSDTEQCVSWPVSILLLSRC